MELPVSAKTYFEEETSQLAVKFASELKGGEVVVLNGELGAGKTFFIKSALKSFGIKYTTSPTFSLVNEYSGKYNIYHFDFYRINNINELYDIGFNDYLNDKEAITFIEWGNLFPGILPVNRIEINIEVYEDFSREITIDRNG